MIVIRALLYAALVRAGRRKATPPPGDPWENIGRLGTRRTGSMTATLTGPSGAVREIETLEF